MPRPAHTFRLLAIGIILLVLATLGISQMLSNRGEGTVHSSSGAVIRLEGYAFRPGSFRYELLNGTAARLFAKILPDAAAKKIRWLRPEATCIVTAAFPNEPLLSAAFSSRDSSGGIQGAGTRLVVLDDHDQSFDTVINALGNGGVFEAVAFPRRGDKLRLRLMDGDVSLAEFGISNPCPGPHPVWQPEHMPVTATNRGVDVILESFVADAARLRTRCVLQVRENGMQSTAWQPVACEISDATGNHWCPAIDGPSTNVNGRIALCFFGALWPEEDAWKLRLNLKPTDGGSKDRTACSVEFVAKPEQVRGDLALPEPTKRVGKQ